MVSASKGMMIKVILRSCAILFLAVSLSACAIGPENGHTDDHASLGNPNDPFETYNRFMFDVNLAVDKGVVRPAASAYEELPSAFRTGVRNFLRNLRSPIILANNILQGDKQGAHDTIARFMSNTIVGLGGLVDIANYNGNGIPYRDEDFGQTLAVWGVSEGPYLQLPLLGPSTLRDTVAIVPDYFLDPVNWWGMRVDHNRPRNTSLGMRATNLVDSRSRNVGQLEAAEATSLDFYASVRSLYRQQRNAAIQNKSSLGQSGSLDAPKKAFDYNYDYDAFIDEDGLATSETLSRE